MEAKRKALEAIVTKPSIKRTEFADSGRAGGSADAPPVDPIIN
jgi:hypothetical protein